MIEAILSGESGAGGWLYRIPTHPMAAIPPLVCYTARYRVVSGAAQQTSSNGRAWTQGSGSLVPVVAAGPASGDPRNADGGPSSSGQLPALAGSSLLR